MQAQREAGRHPAMDEELARLADTLEIIGRERELAAREVEEQAQRVQRLHLEAGGAYSPDEHVAGQILAYMRQSAHHLSLAQAKPYFTRVDFVPEGGAKETPIKETHYIGKWGVLRSEDLSSVVVDWRSPVANLYYSGQVGPMHYVTPDGEARGELTLKRHLAVEEGRLLWVFDTDVVAQDAYLQQALAAVSKARLKEIVSTIQAEQNYVIRHRPARPLVVQGVAGSGKTTIALHRVAWLLYAYQDAMAPEQMLILAPSPMFLDYISAVLPDLGVERVHQQTYSGLALELLGKDAPRLLPDDALGRVLAQTGEERARTTTRLRYMGSLPFREAVRGYIGRLEERIVPAEEIRFGPVCLLTPGQARKILLQELAAFPLRRRVREFGKYLKRGLRDALVQVEGWLTKTCEERVKAIVAAQADGEARRERLKRLYDSRDQRIAEARAAAKGYVDRELAKFPKLELLELYGGLWSAGPPEGAPAAEAEAWALAATEVREALAKRRVHTEDLPALCMLRRAVEGLPRQDVRHLVIDEAQDLSPFQVAFLQEMTGNASFTVVGDLMQGVHAYRGLQSWGELTEGVFGGEATYHQLVTSYRNTVEIMEFATRVAARHPVRDQAQAKPVLRHGPEPEVRGFSARPVRDAFVREQIEAWRGEGFASIAVIGRDAAECRALHKMLPEAWGARLALDEGSPFEPGLLVIPAALVKGLEFDAVLMADVGAARWADDALEARLLYVCLTRPLHRLACCYVGEKSGLLG
ncbi:MAG: AAA family ATPase [Clostridia bacterium]|nr:AAA family ATPase [Clostridia bacterium]